MASTAVPSPSDLPPELLGRIFEHHVQNCIEAYERSPPNVSLTACDRFSAPYAWLRATHVCAYWRAVALAHPLLWSHIVITSSSDCITTFLSRSCGVPLTVRSSHTSSSIPLRSLRLVLAELHRVRSLELISKWWTWDDVATALAKPAPLLRRLSLSTPSGLFDEWFILPVVRLDSAPIEELVLRAYGFPWENPTPYASLRRLRVEKGIPAKPTVDRVVRALQFMPRITSLELHDVFYPSSRDPQGRPLPAETAQLDELQNLELAGDCVACGALLSALEFPPDACIVLDFSSGTRPEDVATALTPLRARFPLESDESRTVLIEESAKSYVLHLSFGTADHLDVTLAKTTARFSVMLRKDSAVFRAACDALDAGSARALWLCGVQDCAALLSAIPNVAHLRISGHSYAQAATLLTYGLTQDASELVIQLEGGALRTMQTLVLADVARAEGKEDLGNLKKAIRRRRRSSGSLSNVVFARCAGVCADDFTDLGTDVEVRVCA